MVESVGREIWWMKETFQYNKRRLWFNALEFKKFNFSVFISINSQRKKLSSIKTLKNHSDRTSFGENCYFGFTAKYCLT